MVSRPGGSLWKRINETKAYNIILLIKQIKMAIVLD